MCGGGAIIMQMRWRKTPQVSLDKLSDGQTIRPSGSVRHAMFRHELRYLRSQIVWQGTSGFSAHWLRTFHKACLKCFLPNQTLRALEWSSHTFTGIKWDKCCSMLFIIVASISVKAQFTVMARCWRIVHSMYCCYSFCSNPVSEPYWSGIFTLQNKTVNANLTIPEIWTAWNSLLLPPPTSCFSCLQNHKKGKVSSCFPPKLIEIVPRDSCARIRRSRKALGWFTQAYDFGSRVPAEALNLAITYNLNV